MMSDVLFENLPEALRCPPAHSWEGPQPGLTAQADEACRYYFSKKTGRLESIVHYNEQGQPDLKILYRAAAEGSHKVRAFEIQKRVGDQFVSDGVVSQDGRIIRTHSLPRMMHGADGALSAIDPHDEQIFITPAGEVVRLEHEGTFFRQPRASYVGRVQNFNPLRPFKVKTVSGVQELSVDRKDVVINPEGFVFQFTQNGLSAIGELVVPELDIPGAQAVNSYHVPHELFTLHMLSEGGIDHDTAYLDIHDPHAREVLEGPLRVVSGKHPFIQKTVPELVDVHGGTAAEQSLRTVERYALELGLVYFAVRHEGDTEARAVFLKAQHLIEQKLWTAIDVFEKTLGASRHSVVSAQDIRAWVDFAAANPREALQELKQIAQVRYAA